MGYFQVDDEGTHVNEYAWNKVASMLYLESPAGSGSSSGYSTCEKGGKPVECAWTDQSQAEAYAHTLAAFFEEFPEYSSNDLYLTGVHSTLLCRARVPRLEHLLNRPFVAGESYAGQYVPNIAHYILNTEPFTSRLKLKGIALGNACWGGNATLVVRFDDHVVVHIVSWRSLAFRHLAIVLDSSMSLTWLVDCALDCVFATVAGVQRTE